MKQRYSILTVLFALLAIGNKVTAKVTLPRIFSNGMVLQQQAECHLWGTAAESHNVTVTTSWDRQKHTVKANGEGRWTLTVKTPEAGGPYRLTLTDHTDSELVIKDILVGELWLCSGQSNMEMPMKGFKGQPVDGMLETLLHCDDPQLRLFTVKRHASLTPVDDVTGEWQATSSASLRNFSATAYFFGQALRQNLHVPVGLVVCCWGGSACEAWMTADWLKAFPQVRQTIRQTDVDKLQQRCPTALYNGMLHPLIGMTMRGAIWYQGEDNVPRYSYYADLLTTMVRGWRSEWGEGDFPFYYAQIAPYDYTLIGDTTNSALLREQQMLAEQRIPNARMAVLLDAGLRYGIHPRKKQIVGERLALLALAHTYGQQGLPEFAVYSNVTFHNDTAVVAFDRSKEWVYFNNGTTSPNFEISDDNIHWKQADAWISRNRVYVHSREVKHPVAVRYAFHNWVNGDLFHDGLPVSSFRTKQ